MRLKPDFELLALKFRPDAENPKFVIPKLEGYSDGLTVIRSPQCPYSGKNVDAILETAKEMRIPVRLIDLTHHELAQNSPCAFGTFCIIYNGKIISHHPISNSRFKNIMQKTK
jgi:YoaP-like